MREIEVKNNDAGQRLDKFLTKTLDLPASLLYKSIRTKKIKLNRKRAEIGTLLSPGDKIQCFLKDELFSKLDNKGAGVSVYSSVIPKLSIIYEDENILLVDKKPGISVHEDEHSENNTLIMHILAYLYQKGEYNPEDEQSFVPALCNRIDRNTGGIDIAAKNAEALRIMNLKIKNREIDKFYLAAVHGIPKKPSDTLKGYLVKNEKLNTVSVFDAGSGKNQSLPRGAKTILTRYNVLAKGDGCALLEVELLTGRTHQIRAHMAHIGHPLIGDGKYGTNKSDRERGYKYQALYSYRLRFNFSEKEKTALDYLNGKEFRIPKDEIYFVRDFIKQS